MEERYKYEFLKFLYEKLKLNAIEKKLESAKISCINDGVSGLYSEISKYFSLVNKVDTSRLTSEMQDKYKYYFSLSHQEIINNGLQEEMNKFLEDSYKLILFPNIKEKFVFYGPINYNYVAPRDSIVLGFNYCEFNIPEENFDELHSKRKAYVCDLSPEQIREYRGTLTEPGKDSPYRNRSIEENLDLFERMKNGEFEDGSKVLRAKIDMASSNINMRDPIIYRVARMTHHNTGDKWCIYPMYDFAHPIEDAIEGITHSICTLEFEDHRPLYDWVVQEIGY